MAYRTEIAVRFGDVDKAGIVYYPVIFHYFHIAQEDFFAHYIGIPYHLLIEEERIGFPTVRTATEFYSPLKYGDLLEIAVHVSQVGRSSVTFEFHVYRQGELLARSSEVKVAVEIDTLEKIDIPEKYRKLLEECRAD
ncbi:MAG TPA: thioesterase family protein [Blastocatellia bacterium]|jgi:4-hydroxybenzoyl-CoA thioesterase